MTKQQVPKNYSGVLSIPLDYHGRGEFPTDLINEYIALPPTTSKLFKDRVDAEIDAACLDHTKEQFAKLPALFAHYGISTNEPNYWRKLALALANRHVRGFQIKKPKGAKVRRPLFDFDLWAKVRLLQVEKKYSATRACALIWKHTDRKGTPSDLRRRFTAANKVFGALYRDLPLDLQMRELLAYQSKMRKKAGLKKRKP